MQFFKPLLPILAATLVSVGIVQATMYKWSQTPATNANSDSFTWAEGQAPSTVNDSARGMMAAIAKYRDDMSGKLVTTGTATAYALTSNQGFTSLALMDGSALSFRMNATSGAAPTLNVDSLGAKALNQATGVAVATGALISGAVYRAVYVNASNEWIVQGIAGLIPSGMTIMSVSTACPAGFTANVSFNDRLPVFAAAGGTTAGTTGFSGIFSGSNKVGSYALTITDIPFHTHRVFGTTGDESAQHTHGYTVPSGTVTAGSGGGGAVNTTGSTSTGVESVGHTHSMDFQTGSGTGLGGGGHDHTIPAVQSVSTIICTKN